jgi:hypothetical protein
MITSPRSLLRTLADARMQAAVLLFLNDAPRSRWWTLAEIEPHVPANLEQLSRLFYSWAEHGWLVNKQDSGRTLWQPSTQMPIVVDNQRDERTSWSDLFSAVLELPVR